jgi:DNA-binding CsgD family transcriptional regulator
LDLPPEKAAQVQQFINGLFTLVSEEELLERVIPQLAEIIPSDFYGLAFFPTESSRKSLFSTRNPQDFIETYHSSLSDKDIFLDYMVDHGNSPALYKDVVTSDVLRSNEFINVCSRIRPAGDGGYFPVIFRNRLAGFFAIARSGSNPLPYSEDEFKLASFLSPFIADGLEQIFAPSPVDGDTGYLDSCGNLLNAGDRIRDLFKLFFGEKYREAPQRNPDMNGVAYRDWLAGFASGSIRPRRTELILTSGFITHRFSLRRLPSSLLRRSFPESPRFMIRLLPESSSRGSKRLDTASVRFSLNARETEIVDLLFKGYSNREIAAELGIATATVKHHLYNIFNKTGADSRTHLLFLIAGIED